MTDPRYVNMSYPSELNYPQTRGGIYLGFNHIIPPFVNVMKPHHHVDSFSDSMLECKIQMKERGKITKMSGCSCVGRRCRDKHGKRCE